MLVLSFISESDNTNPQTGINIVMMEDEGYLYQLQGMHIDDNDGNLILGNDFVTFYTKEQIGINTSRPVA